MTHVKSEAVYKVFSLNLAQSPFSADLHVVKVVCGYSTFSFDVIIEIGMSLAKCSH